MKCFRTPMPRRLNPCRRHTQCGENCLWNRRTGFCVSRDNQACRPGAVPRWNPKKEKRKGPFPTSYCGRRAGSKTVSPCVRHRQACGPNCLWNRRTGFCVGTDTRTCGQARPWRSSETRKGPFATTYCSGDKKKECSPRVAHPTTAEGGCLWNRRTGYGVGRHTQTCPQANESGKGPFATKYGHCEGAVPPPPSLVPLRLTGPLLVPAHGPALFPTGALVPAPAARRTGDAAPTTPPRGAAAQKPAPGPALLSTGAFVPAPAARRTGDAAPSPPPRSGAAQKDDRLSELAVKSWYLGESTLTFGGKSLTFKILLDQSDEFLEKVHDYIQVLFPNRAASRVSTRAPLLDDSLVVFFRNHPDKVKLALERMERFFDRTSAWKNKDDHNQLRITRILKFLLAIGMTVEFEKFYEKLKLGTIGNSYWNKEKGCYRCQTDQTLFQQPGTCTECQEAVTHWARQQQQEKKKEALPTTMEFNFNDGYTDAEKLKWKTFERNMYSFRWIENSCWADSLLMALIFTPPIRQIILYDDLGASSVQFPVECPASAGLATAVQKEKYRTEMQKALRQEVQTLANAEGTCSTALRKLLTSCFISHPDKLEDAAEFYAHLVRIFPKLLLEQNPNGPAAYFEYDAPSDRTYFSTGKNFLVFGEAGPDMTLVNASTQKMNLKSEKKGFTNIFNGRISRSSILVDKDTDATFTIQAVLISNKEHWTAVLRYNSSYFFYDDLGPTKKLTYDEAGAYFAGDHGKRALIIYTRT